MIRLSRGRLRTGFYRTQLLPGRAVEDMLRSAFREVYAIATDRYFTSFACAP